jgi:glycosyltransferase involved in cell wall biosynthesis
MVRSNFLSELNYLILCPSLEWGANERSALRDALFIKEVEGYPLILTLRDSPLEYYAKNAGLDCIYLKSKNYSKFFDFSLYFLMKDVIRSNNINLIHAYDIDLIGTLIPSLGPFLDVPLVLTNNQILSQKKKNFFKKLLFNRLDLILTLNRTIKNNLEDCLPIKSRRVHALGAGLKFTHRKKHVAANEEVQILCYIPPFFEKVELIETLFLSLHPLEAQLETFKSTIKKFSVTLVTTRKWDEYFIYQDLKKIVDETNLKGMVHFLEANEVEDIIEDYDLFMALEEEHKISDYEVMAIYKELPIIIPRISSRVELLEQFPMVGESFHLYDSRELKDKILKILVNRPAYQTSLKNQHQRIYETHSYEGYVNRLKNLYENVVETRKRALQNR